ncbi:MAG: glutamate mutase L [bacterium]|nr:glutamate mutase L [bacterium]
MTENQKEIKSILATDCGSTTTKAILIEKQGDEYRLVVRGEAPTTVEAPVEDVTKGVLNAIQEVEELVNKKFLDDDFNIIKPGKSDKEGVDIYISTSSAGGGLQMMVAGVVKSMSTESAERAALGAGAIVMDAIATNDGRLMHEKIELIRNLRPDMILLSGGTDGGTTTHVVEIAEIIESANPRPRLGTSYELPVIFAGNKNARELVRERLEKKTAFEVVDNIRPVLERENLLPARLKIQELFLEHVMAHAPGYKTLIEWTDVPIMPTPGAVGLIMQEISKQQNIQIVGVDIGGATTDVFSIFENPEPGGEPVFNRTVSANLGMSYSISNVFAEAGLDNIMRWVPFKMNERDLRNRVRNKMIRPTTIPQSLKELVVEQGISREALRLAFKQHKSLAVGLKGVQQQRTISDAFDQEESGGTLVNMMALDMLVGSGGVLSHAPRRNQAALMMMDAFVPEGFTELTVDSIFMMPQLGVLSQVNVKAATQVFEKDCLIYLGTCISPTGIGKEGKKALKITITYSDGKTVEDEIDSGLIKVFPLGVGETAEVDVLVYKPFDMGEGKGKNIKKTVRGGTVGIIVDTRGRPLIVPTNEDERVKKLHQWIRAMDAYPESIFSY